MKTVIDAVKALNGDLEFANQGDSGYPYLLVDIHNGSYWLSSMGKSAVESSKDYSYICTVNEFNACVDELSAATWIDGISLEEWKAKMKNTVIDSHGNELEIGNVYEFSDNGVNWFPSALVCLTGSEYQYCASSAKWIIIRECQSPLGTIKKAPIKLVDGKAYQFELSKAVYCGFFNEKDDCFCVSTANDACVIGYLSGCTNILALNYESK